MSNAILIIAKETHFCRKCKKDIVPGDKAVKSIGRESTCGESHATTVYLHENCWKPARNQNS